MKSYDEVSEYFEQLLKDDSADPADLLTKIKDGFDKYCRISNEEYEKNIAQSEAKNGTKKTEEEYKQGIIDHESKIKAYNLYSDCMKKIIKMNNEKFGIE